MPLMVQHLFMFIFHSQLFSIPINNIYSSQVKQKNFPSRYSQMNLAANFAPVHSFILTEKSEMLDAPALKVHHFPYHSW